MVHFHGILWTTHKLRRNKYLAPMNDNENIESAAQISESMGLSEVILSHAERRAQKITKSKLRFVETALRIKEESPELHPMAFLATFLIQCTLPHSDPGNVPIWKRVNNEYTLAIQPGWDFILDKPLGYPFGTLPRLLLIWIVTEAKRTNCRRLTLGSTLTSFLHKLNLEPYSRHKKHSDAVRVQEAMRRLFSARIMFYRSLRSQRFNGKEIVPVVGENVSETQVSSGRQLLWENNQSQDILSESWIELGADFFAAIMKSTVPCNMDAVRALRQSPLALDLYMLLNWLGAGLQERKEKGIVPERKEHFLKWNWLGEQLGSDYANTGDLRRKIKKEMLKVAPQLPDLKWKYDNKRGGIVVYPSTPAIPRKMKV